MKKKILLFVLIVVLVYAIGGFIYIKLNKKPDVIQVSDLDKINGYNYTLKSNDTQLQTDEFNVLKANLESESINYEEYAKSVAKLFIIDLYTLNSKINKYDVGGAQYVYPDAVSNYKLNVQNTIYKYMEDNTNKNRNQILPEVSTIDITKFEETTYKIEEKEYPGYKAELSWTYVEDLGYDTNAEVLLIKQDKTYYVVEDN